jgi:hypothetical protein
MRRMIAFATVLTMSLAAPLVAAPRAARAQGQAATGTINGTASGAQGQALPNYIVRARNLADGNSPARPRAARPEVFRSSASRPATTRLKS